MVVVSAILLVVLILAQRSPFFIMGTEVVSILFLAILGLGDFLWLLQAFLILGLFYIVVNQRGGFELVKSLLFYLQTANLFASEEIWLEWMQNIFSQLNFVNFKFSGVECIFPSLASPVARTAFFMGLPGVVLVVAVLLIVVGHFLRRFSSYVYGRLCSCIRGREGYKPLPKSDGLDIDGEEIDRFSAQPHLGINEDQDSEDDAEPYEEERTLLQTVVHGILLLMFTFYFEVSNKVLILFQPCASGYMAEYHWIPCNWEGEHLYMMLLGFVFLVLYILGIPFLFAILLFRWAKEIRSNDNEDTVSHAASSLPERYFGFLF